MQLRERCPSEVHACSKLPEPVGSVATPGRRRIPTLSGDYPAIADASLRFVVAAVQASRLSAEMVATSALSVVNVALCSNRPSRTFLDQPLDSR